MTMRRVIPSFILALICVISIVGPSNAQFMSQQTWVQPNNVSGTANDIILNMPNVTNASDIVGVPIRFSVKATNTGPVTVAVSPVAAIPVYEQTGAGLVPISPGRLVGPTSGNAGNEIQIILNSASGGVFALTTPPPIIIPVANSIAGIISSGAYNPNSGVRRVHVKVWGGGGGGASVGPGSHCAGNGGGGAEFREAIVSITPNTSVSVTIGGGGGPGSDGSPSSFGSFVTANGGRGATGCNATGVPGAGGSGGSGGFGFNGYPGGFGFTTNGNDNLSGNGGASFSTSIASGVCPACAFSGSFPGGGGAGANGGGGSGVGGSGSNGLVLVEELSN